MITLLCVGVQAGQFFQPVVRPPLRTGIAGFAPRVEFVAEPAYAPGVEVASQGAYVGLGVLLGVAAASVALRPHASLAVAGDATAIEVVKVRLLAACKAAAMGRDLDRRPSVSALIEELESLNPTEKPLQEPELLSGCWRLMYTTSDSILGTERPRLFRPRNRILQSIDAASLTAFNEEWVLGGLLRNSVRAELTPRDDSTADVQFKRFGIGWLGIPAPASARGFLETTFLDSSLRISRGNKDNLFVLVREGPPRS